MTAYSVNQCVRNASNGIGLLPLACSSTTFPFEKAKRWQVEGMTMRNGKESRIERRDFFKGLHRLRRNGAGAVGLNADCHSDGAKYIMQQ